MCCLCWIVVRCVLSVSKEIMCVFCSFAASGDHWRHMYSPHHLQSSLPLHSTQLWRAHTGGRLSDPGTSTNIYSCSCKCTYSSTHIIWLPVDPQVDESTVRETGWLYGSYRGNSGWFPESYAERCSKESQVELTAPVTHSTAPSTNYPGYGTKTAVLLTRLCNLA